jgi:hypothetical protein
MKPRKHFAVQCYRSVSRMLERFFGHLPRPCRSADLQVSRIAGLKPARARPFPVPGFHRTSADWKSAIQQTKCLRYFGCGFVRLHGGCLWNVGRCLAVVLALVLLSGSLHGFVYETATEFHTSADVDGDGRLDLVIVDKATGSYRIAYQFTADNHSWVPARASGIQRVSGFAVGRLNATTRNALVFTAPEANRLNILDAGSSTSAGLPAPVFISSIGPSLVGAIDIGGAGNTTHDDLYVATELDFVPREVFVRNDGSNRTQIVDSTLGPGPHQRANTILLKNGQPPQLALLRRNAPSALDQFTVSTFATGPRVTSLSIFLGNTPKPSEYLTGKFSSTGLLHHVLFYRPTQSNFSSYAVQESSGTYSFSGGVNIGLGKSIRAMVAVPEAAETRLLVLFDNGETASIYRYDGFTSLALVKSFGADSNALFSGASDLGGGKFALYDGRGGSSTDFKIYHPNGTNDYTLHASGALPSVNPLSAAGNVLLFKNEPFVNNSPYLVRALNAGDWSSALTFSGGSPPNVSVTSERYAGEAQGLRNPVSTPLGASHPLAAFGLVNQYSSVISLFSLQSAIGDEVSEVKISPPSGTYKTSLSLAITASDPTHQIFYRYAPGGGWLTYVAPFPVFTNTTVQYYAKVPAGNAKSAIHTAVYKIEEAPSMLDSDADGVPDFVEIAKGLDPVNSGRDSDGDGYTDLEELLRNTDPAAASSAPTNYARLELKAVFDRAVTPTPRDGTAHVTSLAVTGTAVRAYSMQGSLLAFTTVSNISVPGVTSPAARLTNIVVETQDRLVVEATDLHYNIQTSSADKKIGRELVGLVPIPPVRPITVGYSSPIGNILTAANSWIQTASNAYLNATREISKGDLSVRDTLTAVLFERKVAEVLQARGTNWATNLTLFPFRPSDIGRSNVFQRVLLSLEKQVSPSLPGYRLQAIYNSISNDVENSSFGAIQNLRAITTEIFDINSAHNNTSPATFLPPLDELRYFLQHSAYDSNYAARAALPNVVLLSAFVGASNILAAVPPRPVTNVIVVALATNGQTRFVLQGTSLPVFLYKDDGTPYDLPDSFGVVTGSELQVSGYADLPPPLSGLSLEVISVSLSAIPIASDLDADGNLLVDTWEKLFFGNGQDAFADNDGDGYSNLQEMFENSDPDDPFGIPAVVLMDLEAPLMEIVLDGSQIRLRFEWPALYINRIDVGVKATATLGTPFTSVPATGPTQIGANLFEVVVPSSALTEQFYFLYLALRWRW